MSRDALDGPDLLAALVVASDSLRANARAVDAINVYPVPDGDTGSNMAATMREAVETARAVAPPLTVAAILQALARGALYGARGNSGVILSQALRGLAEGVGTVERCGGEDIERGLEAAARAAYAAVSKPVEGTMLTVLRAAAAGATRTSGDLATRLAAAVTAAEIAEAQTPSQLPALAEAGVTDAGGEGVCVILRGLLAGVRGEAAPAPEPIPERPLAELAGHGTEEYGFCTEFVIEAVGEPLEVERVRDFAGSGGNRSVVVVGDATVVRVHVHSDEPERTIEGAGGFGRVSRVKIEDMTAQHGRFAESGSGAGAKVAVLALSPGAGFDALFESIGVRVARLGELVKPAASEIAEAANALRSADVIVLPNHGNVLLAARQAAAIARCTLTVVETESVPQGIAAALTFDPGETAANNATVMRDAAGNVRTVEVTVAAADRAADGVMARAGQPIALVDGTLVHSGGGLADALLAGLERAGADEGGLATIYAGRDISDGELEAARAAVAERFPGTELEAMRGDQSLYAFIASVEA